MKRPLATAGFTMLGALFAFSKLNNNTAMSVAFAVTLIAFLVFVFAKPLRKYGTITLSLFIVLVSIVALYTADVHYGNAVNAYAGKTVEISGTPSQLPYSDYGKYYYVIKTDTVNGQSERLNIRLVSDGPLDLEPTDSVSVRAWVFRLGENGESYLDYYKSRGLFLGAKIRDAGKAVIVKSSRITPSGTLLKLRYRFSQNIMNELGGDKGAVICAMLLGDKTQLSNRSEAAFRNCGISHLFSVSGFHLSLWSMMIFGFLRKLRFSQKKSSAVSIGFCVFFMLLTGFNPPVVRAGFMLICVFAANLFAREADAFNSIGLSLLIMLLINPYNALSVSLWLSLLATLSIITYAFPLSQKLYRPFVKLKNRYAKSVVNYILSMISVTICATVATLPVYVFVFGNMSTLGIVSNLAMVFIGSVCMLFSGIASVLIITGLTVLGSPLMKFCGVLSSILINVAERLSGFRYALINVSSTASKITVIVGIAVLAIILIAKPENKKLIRVAAVACILAFFVTNAFVFAIDYNRLCICVCNGECVSATVSYKGKTALIYNGSDSYGSSALVSAANSRGITYADYLITTSDASGLDNLKDSLHVSETQIRKDISLCDGELNISADGKQVLIDFNQTKIVFLFSDDIMLERDGGGLIIDEDYISSLASPEMIYVSKDGGIH